MLAKLGLILGTTAALYLFERYTPFMRDAIDSVIACVMRFICHV